ncbi:hypothetical protein AVEN_144233-1 [Araneus ventricosus]|uniref:Reverse transcriptase domain-containing protein n=1 Tax=Araneus ventricosus TaxID=182803 RepID=A0A4Y2Q4V5_ARAVE|nr:hypothetical protein AVEN_186821-1 [Araneus ventricosus]GBN58252.1 hypothetical protein AVEN_251658-1 [Araneus ventricosus]GBN67577.1 hypothetical protein AVEN_165850-1 [Araneus ventricosus]GBN67616.1 hypothetical protein AVEN_144233-1 [Araneus ventricosus]
MLNKPGKNPKISNSYRPISLLSSVGKIFEKVLQKRINNFCDTNNIIPSEQLGFRTHHSTVHQLLHATNSITEDFPSHTRTIICLFADDSAVLAQGSTVNYVLRTLQSFLYSLEEWLTKWRIAVNTDKTKAIMFRKGHPNHNPSILELFDEPIEWVTEVKYLGLVIDNKLTFRQHISYLKEKFWAKIYLCLPLIGDPVFLSRTNSSFSNKSSDLSLPMLHLSGALQPHPIGKKSKYFKTSFSELLVTLHGSYGTLSSTLISKLNQLMTTFRSSQESSSLGSLTIQIA